MKKNIKFIFKIIFLKDFKVSIKIEKVDTRIAYYYDYNLFRTKSNYLFEKGNYLHIGMMGCTLPNGIKGDYTNLYTSNLNFNSDLEMKEFLVSFKNDLEEFSKSELFMKNPFIDDERVSENRVAFFQNYWIVY